MSNLPRQHLTVAYVTMTRGQKTTDSIVDTEAEENGNIECFHINRDYEAFSHVDLSQNEKRILSLLSLKIVNLPKTVRLKRERSFLFV